jgi:hypothetical protein
VDLKLELVVIPVSGVDRAQDFYCRRRASTRMSITASGTFAWSN